MTDKCTICGGTFTHDEVQKQVQARVLKNAISKSVIGTVHERCLDQFESQAKQQYGDDWRKQYDVEVADAWPVG